MTKLLLFAIILFFLLTFFNIYKESFENNKIIAMTFGGGGENYYDAVERINKEIEDTKTFNKIYLYYDKDLMNDKPFWEKHGYFIENNKRGYGYWLWKPYLISKTLKKMNDNDILLYLDSGCEIINNSKIQELINKCNTYDMLYTLTGHSNNSYVKKDILNYFNVTDDTIQKQASFIFIKKTNLTCDFIDDWYKACCNYHLIDDSESIEPNHITFIENRHDQAIFSILLNTDKYKTLNTENNYIDENPILISRKRGK